MRQTTSSAAGHRHPNRDSPRSRKLRLAGLVGVLLTSVIVLVFSDPSNAGPRFLAKLSILGSVVVVLTSLVVTHFWGRGANRRFWGRLALLGVSVGSALVAAEFVVRFVFRDVTTTQDNTSYFSRRWYDRQAQSRNLPRPPETREPIPRSDGLGDRDTGVSERAAPATYRIAVIGDSFTFGQGISIGERFSDQLQRELNKTTGRYQIMNFGRPGAETDDHLRILDELVLDLSPDFVLVQWYVNDVEVVPSNRATPIRLIPSDFVRSWLHAHSALYYLVDARWTSLQAAIGLTEPYVDGMIRRFAEPDSEESVAASQALDRLVERLKQAEVAGGIVLFPMMVDVAGDANRYPLGFLMDRVLSACDRHQVPCLDLRPVFASALTELDLWANRLDHHPSATAHRVASHAILDRFGAIWGAQ